MTFQLDTSGTVARIGYGLPLIFWSDLDPFTQGYVEAVFAELLAGLMREPDVWCDEEDPGLPPSYEGPRPAFSDLAPETLARIVEDCARFVARYPDADRGRAGGAHFWARRQDRFWLAAFPPLTAYLRDDGKVYLREAS